MENFKKRLIYLICLGFLTALFTVAVSSASISPNHWAIDYADFVTNMGIMTGGRSDFSPEASITRAEAAYAMAKIKNSSFSSTTPPTEFSDVNSSTKYAGAIKWAVDNGLVNGFPEGTFRPTAGILRKDFCVLLKRYCDKFGVSLAATTSAPSFTDSGDIPSYASSAVIALCRAGVVNGYDDGTFRPNVEVRRSEAAAAFTRIRGLQYNGANRITLYIKNYAGAAVKDAWVYIYRPKDTSGDMYPYNPVISDAKGFAIRPNLSTSSQYGVNVFHDNYGAVTIPNKIRTSKFYVFVTLPKRSTYAMQTPISSFLAINKWPHPDNCPCECTRICPKTYYRAQIPQNFGWRYGVTSELEFHQAIDISYPRGTEVRCTFPSGNVTIAEYKQGCGNTVQIQNTHQSSDGAASKYFATYMHLDTISVSYGQKANNYTKVGTVGNTGTTAVHLHFSLAKEALLSASSNNPTQISKFVDPFAFMP